MPTPLIPILATSELSASWALFMLGLGALIFIFILQRLVRDYLKYR